MSGVPCAVVIINNCGRVEAGAAALGLTMEATAQAFIEIADDLSPKQEAKLLALCEESKAFTVKMEAFRQKWLTAIDEVTTAKPATTSPGND